jgi:hypothetical protein
LRAAGTALALPLLEAMLPARLLGRPEAIRPPKRACFVYAPNGVNLTTWFPKKVGPDYDLPFALEPLAAVRSDVTVFRGLDRTFVGGTGVHAQCGACWLTSSPPSEALDGGFPTNVSLDQLLAREIGAETLVPSLELSCNDFADNKETKYFESVSWLAPGFAASVEKNPRAVFDRLFGKPDGDPLARSVLDTILADARGLHRRLGQTDRQKLAEYLESVQATEERIQRAERLAARRPAPPLKRPEGIPAHRGEYIRLMFDLIALAFQQDLTRVATLVLDPERWDSPRMYHDVFDAPQNHHVLTHTKGPEAKEKLGKIDRFHVEQFAYFVSKTKALREGDGCLLDSCAVVFGSGISDGDSHNYKDLPVLLAGKVGGTIQPGRHRAYPGERPLSDLWLTLLAAFGVERARFADSMGLLKDLTT